MESSEIIKRNIDFIDSFNDANPIGSQVKYFCDENEVMVDFTDGYAYGRGEDYTAHIELKISGEVLLFNVVPYMA